MVSLGGWESSEVVLRFVLFSFYFTSQTFSFMSIPSYKINKLASYKLRTDAPQLIMGYVPINPS